MPGPQGWRPCMAIEEVRAFLLDAMGPADTPIAVRKAKSELFAGGAPVREKFRIAAEMVSGVPVEWIVPSGAAPTPIFLHLHGGGYVMGDPAGSRPFTTELALRSGARVASVEYRLAPEHLFPAAVDDALAVYRGPLGQGFEPSPLAAGGGAAGAALA